MLTEAEWEYACLAGTTGAYHDGSACTEPSGNDPALDRLGWFSKNSGGSTQPVGLKACNDWGLYDMHGNVWEWCEDFFEKNYYSVSPADDPKGPATGTTRVLRGGCWGVGPVQTRSSGRDYYGPGHRSYFIGFRIVAELSEDRRRQS